RVAAIYRSSVGHDYPLAVGPARLPSMTSSACKGPDATVQAEQGRSICAAIAAPAAPSLRFTLLLRELICSWKRSLRFALSRKHPVLLLVQLKCNYLPNLFPADLLGHGAGNPNVLSLVPLDAYRLEIVAAHGSVEVGAFRQFLLDL